MIKQKNNYILKKRDKTDGFTLIELLVAMAIFSVVVVVAVDIFLMGLGGAQRIFGSQAVQEGGRFIMESMAKEVRMSRVNSLDGVAYLSLPNGVSGPYASLNITNAHGQTLDYVFDGASQQVRRAGEILSSNDIEATGKFYLTKSGSLQSRVTVVLNLINKSARAGQRAAINLQTTVSSREYAP